MDLLLVTTAEGDSMKILLDEYRGNFCCSSFLLLCLSLILTFLASCDTDLATASQPDEPLRDADDRLQRAIRGYLSFSLVMLESKSSSSRDRDVALVAVHNLLYLVNVLSASDFDESIPSNDRCAADGVYLQQLR